MARSLQPTKAFVAGPLPDGSATLRAPRELRRGLRSTTEGAEKGHGGVALATAGGDGGDGMFLNWDE